ncbi:HAMP domain-containing sensor histidine kinase [Methylocystis sp. B8]|uniref:sensor histidine kinase n=1 Tax=Methylocystis sp. B8 TaxID=544938 RepID=UPI0010FCF880|nr:HAMP domain-containing sensor histidine kinase [Methylocystis sp. B8]TLG71861.1 HAMP domain-containing histidine kinase [Methylocystis sp. B8]
MIAQLIGVIAEYWFNQQELARHSIQREADALFRGLWRNQARLGFDLPAGLHGRYDSNDGSYLVRIRTGSGAILYTNCIGECPLRLLPSYASPPDFWMIRRDPETPWKVAGGKTYRIDDELVTIEMAVLQDRAGVVLTVLAREVFDHMALPMSLMLVVVLGASIFSIRRTLEPIKAAADLAEKLNPADSNSNLPLAGMPREIAALIQAVNKSFGRVREVVQAQKIFTSAISHEVRTPIAIARLELEKIADPRARKVEQDLVSLNWLVEQLTTLARLESADLSPVETITPFAIAESVVGALAPVAYDSGRSLELTDRGGRSFLGRPALVENALRNLIENAIRHTTPGSAIVVEVGPGPQFCVRDNGRQNKIMSDMEEPKGVGLGLKIVHRIAETQCGFFSFERMPDGQGSIATLSFGASLPRS